MVIKRILKGTWVKLLLEIEMLSAFLFDCVSLPYGLLDTDKSWDN